MKHDDFKFKAQFMDEIIDCRLQFYWTDTYYLFINKRLDGILMKRYNYWKFTPTADQDYNSDDILVLADMIETNFKD